MLTATRINEEVSGYRDRVDSLYKDIRRWIAERRSDAVFSQTDLEVSEEYTGAYTLQSLEISLPTLPAVRFVPRGIFMVGAHGRVDVRSRLGREVLVWVKAAGADQSATGDIEEESDAEVSRPLFSNVAEGWALSDPRHRRILGLDSNVIWDRVLRPLTE
jgi:hypothetical protein